jgi:hypothetical protein
MKKVKDLTNQKFGRLIVLNKSYPRKNKNGNTNNNYWTCLCDCGNTKDIYGGNLTSKGTLSCGCYIKEKAKALGKISGLKKRKGTKNITGNYWCNIRNGAKQRDLELSISIDYAQQLLEKQNFKCALTGRNLIMDIENTYDLKGTNSLNTASLDRIDSNKGYIEGNVQWVHKNINRIKMDFEQQEFIDLCYEVTKHNNKGRHYNLSLGELIDRLSIVQLKELKIKENRESYSKEIKEILHDIQLIIDEEKPKITAKTIRAIIIISIFNEFIWANEGNFRKGIKEGNNLEMSHGFNSIRNLAKNKIQEILGGRLDLKLDNVEAFKDWVPSGYDK